MPEYNRGLTGLLLFSVGALLITHHKLNYDVALALDERMDIVGHDWLGLAVMGIGLYVVK